MLKLTPYGGAENATGANFLLEFGEKKVLVDCGMQQGGEGAHKHNRRPFPYDPASIDYLFVTHAHIDHVGLIPKLVKEGFKGEIRSTPETKAIAELLLQDAAKIGADNGEPLYTLEDIAHALRLWKPLPYHEKEAFGLFTVEAFDAGHVLGSAMYKFLTEQGSLLCTGDIGNSPSPLLRDREKVPGLDYLLMESVYGDRNHEGRDRREAEFTRIVREAVAREGALLIPAFSLERTQMILAALDNLFEDKVVSPVPVYLDSPLAIKLTEVYEKETDLFNQAVEKEKHAGDDVFKFKELKEIARYQESHEIWNVPGPKIILAGSGMSTAGRILAHEKHYLPDPASTILFMGYQAAGTLGRQIEEGVKKVDIDGVWTPVRARVEKIQGFSGHADSNALVAFVAENEQTLKRVFVAMGESASQTFLAQRLRDELGVEAVAVEEGKSYELDL